MHVLDDTGDKVRRAISLRVLSRSRLYLLMEMRQGIGKRIHCVFFFFFQAEDGIRDVAVTGVQTCALPISSKARKRLSVVAPINTTPPAVTIDPPRFGVPVVVFSSSTLPSATFQTISPLFTSTAFNVPHGGFWQGHSFSSQNLAYSPPLAPRRNRSGASSACGCIAPTAPSSFAFTNK